MTCSKCGAEYEARFPNDLPSLCDFCWDVNAAKREWIKKFEDWYAGEFKLHGYIDRAEMLQCLANVLNDLDAAYIKRLTTSR